jgi:ATP-binding cassette subfamily F protein 3
MLQVSNLAKRFGDTLLFEQVSFTLNRGERVGLVGPNGCGKSTLLRLIVGQERPDTGSVQFLVPRSRVGYLAQGLEYAAQTTVRSALQGDEHTAGYWATQVEALAQRMAHSAPDEMESVAHAYSQALERLGQAAESLPDHVIAEVLAGLQLDHVQPDTAVDILSGGQKTRLGLARLLLANPSLLLLDEPTNHLDITALEWLEGYLSAYDGAMLIVSHDRTFLDHTINTVLEMDPVTHAVRAYPGNYTLYAQTKEREAAKLQLAFNEQQARIERLQSAIREAKGHARNIEHETIDFHYRKQAKKIARQGVMHQRRLERMLGSEDLLDKPKAGWSIRLEFAETPSSGQDVLVLEDLAKAFGQRVLFAGVNLVLRRGERVALIGANGTGKTTLLRIITGEQEPTAGSVRLGANVHYGYLSQEQENLDPALTPLEMVQQVATANETDARSFLHQLLFSGDDVFTPVGRLSFGERSRLALGVLVLQGCNLLLLDESINHLDIPSRERFEHALQSYEGTVLAVVHDRYFIERFATSIWALADGGIRPFVDLTDVARQQDATL